MKVTPAELMALQKRVGGAVVGDTGGLTNTQTPLRRAPGRDGYSSGLAGSNPARPPYKSKLENAYAGYLHALKLAGDITLYRYEQVRLKLMDGVTYVPDFYVRWKDGSEEWHEVKGYAKARNQERGIIKLRVAAHTWPHWRFVLVTHARGRWEHHPMVTG